ncbi:cytochrome P450 [Actinocatenispora thailandica]|uniref:cytochrome P450 n=1 Tax=Actinocatenispora thailandica TaxID=227318 RepID=UPI0019525AAD|nr:cytochrome P450 [Actinocatenispora thailandica]
MAARLLSTAGRADPYPIYRRLHEQGSVLCGPDGPTLVVGHSAARVALRDRRLLVEDAEHLDMVAPLWRTMPSRRLLGDAMILVNGEAHDKMRRLVGQAFTAHRVDALRPLVADRIGRLLDRLVALGAGGGSVDFMAEFAFPLPVNVVGDLLGVPDADRPRLRQLIAELARALEPDWPRAELTKADRAAFALSEYFHWLLERRRDSPRADLISAMAAGNATADDPLSSAELVANAVFLLLAGFETTVGLLGNGFQMLVEHPAELTRLRRRPDRAAAFVTELLRCEAPVQMTARRAARDLEIDGTAVPAGGAVIILIAAANRDPSRFVEPDRFDSARLVNDPLSFSGGVHYCLGARLARLEGELAFSMLATRLARLSIAGTPRLLDRFNLRGYASLPVSVD